MMFLGKSFDHETTIIRIGSNWEDGSVTGWWVVDVSGVSPDLLVEQSLVE